MALTAGTYSLGPDNAKLAVRTGKAGAIAIAGHNLLIEVTSWNATLVIGEESSLTLSADSNSMKVLDGTGGAKPLGADDKDGITKTIDQEVLKGGKIDFRSTGIHSAGDRLIVDGELDLLGTKKPLGFQLTVGDDGSFNGAASFKQTDWGMKPYSAMFGTLKVADEIKVEVEGTLPAA